MSSWHAVVGMQKCADAADLPPVRDARELSAQRAHCGRIRTIGSERVAGIDDAGSNPGPATFAGTVIEAVLKLSLRLNSAETNQKSLSLMAGHQG